MSGSRWRKSPGHQFDDELGSDDELMVGFNETSKGRKSPKNSTYGSERKSPWSDKSSKNDDDDDDDDVGYGNDNPLTMTLKQPLNTTSFLKKDARKESEPSKSRTLGAGEDSLDGLLKKPQSQPASRWQKPAVVTDADKRRTGAAPPTKPAAKDAIKTSAKPSSSTSSTSAKASKSPGRHSPTLPMDAIEEEINPSESDDDGFKSPRSFGSKSPKSPASKSPFDKSRDKSPQGSERRVGESLLADKRKSPLLSTTESRLQADRRGSSLLSDKSSDRRDSPYSGKKSPYNDDLDRKKYSDDSDRKKYSDDSDRKKQTYPWDTSSDRKSPGVGVSGRTEDSRKSPGVERKSPLDRKMSPGSSAGDRERKSPAVDIFGKNRSDFLNDILDDKDKDVKKFGSKSPTGGDKLKSNSDKKTTDGRGLNEKSRRDGVVDDKRRSPTSTGDKKPSSFLDMLGEKPKPKKSLLLDSSDESEDSADEEVAEVNKKKGRTRDGKGEHKDVTHKAKSPAMKGHMSDDKINSKEKREKSILSDNGSEDEREEQKRLKDNERQSRPRSRTLGAREERESSLCRDSEDEESKKDKKKKKKAKKDRSDSSNSSSSSSDDDKDKENEKESKSDKKDKKKKKHQTTENQMLDDVIDKVESAQKDVKTDNKMHFIDASDDKHDADDSKPRKSKTDTKAESKSASLVRPKPRYAKPGVSVSESVDPAESMNLNSSRAIRDVVFMAWEQQKLKKIKADLEAKRKLEKEAEDKKKQEKQETQVEAKASYQSWLDKKQDYFKEKSKEKRSAVKKKEEEEHAKQEKTKEVTTFFNKWKESKDEELREKERKKKREEERKKEKEAEEKKLKQKDSEQMFKIWKKQKDEKLAEQQRKQMEETKRKKYEEREEEKKLEKEAEQLYNEWLEKKEEQQRRERRQKRQSMQRSMDDDEQPWRPSSRTIPFGH